jgi:hypothetical protein
MFSIGAGVSGTDGYQQLQSVRKNLPFSETLCVTFRNKLHVLGR